MANEELKEQIDLTQQLNILEQEYGDTLKRGNSTVEDRMASMKDAIAHSDNNVKLGEISKDLMAKSNTLAKDGKKILANKYRITADSVTKQISENKVAKVRADIAKQARDQQVKSLNAADGLAKSLLTQIGLGAGLVTIFKKFNEMTRVIGKEFGALGMTNEKFKTDMLEASAAATSLGQSITEITAISKELTDNFGFGRDESVAMAEGIMDTSMALGISNSEGVKLLGTLTDIAGMSFETAQNFAKQTQLLAEAEGVSPNTVMRDIAASSETIAKFTGMTPEHLMKAAIQATKLGTTLSTIAGSMEGMLDFQTSLNCEIEASIMLGRDVNLQKARELALAGKADEFAVELTKQVGSQAEFEKLNVLQRQSLSKALGISVEQMAQMVNNQEKIRTLGDAIADQDGLEKMIGSKALDGMAEIVANLQRVGSELVISIGPTVSKMASGIVSFTSALSKTKTLMPALVGFMTIMAAKSLTSAYTSLITAAALSGIGPGSLAAALAITAGGAALITAGMPSLETEGKIKETGFAKVHAGESVGVFNEKLIVDAITEQTKDNKKLREQNETLIAEMKRTGLRTAEAIANIS